MATLELIERVRTKRGAVRSKYIHLSVSAKLLTMIDLISHEEMCTRSELLRRAAHTYLQQSAERHARLMQLIEHADAPTEDELFELLRRRRGRRASRLWLQEWRRSMRSKS